MCCIAPSRRAALLHCRIARIESIPSSRQDATGQCDILWTYVAFETNAHLTSIGVNHAYVRMYVRTRVKLSFIGRRTSFWYLMQFIAHVWVYGCVCLHVCVCVLLWPKMDVLGFQLQDWHLERSDLSQYLRFCVGERSYLHTCVGGQVSNCVITIWLRGKWLRLPAFLWCGNAC